MRIKVRVTFNHSLTSSLNLPNFALPKGIPTDLRNGTMMQIKYGVIAVASPRQRGRSSGLHHLRLLYQSLSRELPTEPALYRLRCLAIRPLPQGHHPTNLGDFAHRSHLSEPSTFILAPASFNFTLNITPPPRNSFRSPPSPTTFSAPSPSVPTAAVLPSPARSATLASASPS